MDAIALEITEVCKQDTSTIFHAFRIFPLIKHTLKKLTKYKQCLKTYSSDHR